VIDADDDADAIGSRVREAIAARLR
jgi:hypothetical protein